MYRWLWKTLPGGAGWKTVETIMLIVLFIGVLFWAVFPRVSIMLNLDGGTIGMVANIATTVFQNLGTMLS